VALNIASVPALNILIDTINYYSKVMAPETPNPVSGMVAESGAVREVESTAAVENLQDRNVSLTDDKSKVLLNCGRKLQRKSSTNKSCYRNLKVNLKTELSKCSCLLKNCWGQKSRKETAALVKYRK